MSLNRKKAIDIMKKASGSQIEEKSVTEIPHGFLSVLAGKKQVICITDGACAFADRLDCPIDEYRYGLRIRFADMNNKNSQALRFFLKWTAPASTGSASSIGFEDDFGLLLPAAEEQLAATAIKPVILSHMQSAEKLSLAMGDVAWQALASGLANGYGSEFCSAKSEQEIMNALLCGYTGIVIDAAAKVDRAALKLLPSELASNFGKLNDDFKEALQASYLDKKFTVSGMDEFTYSQEELSQYSLSYGEAIAFLQYMYNAYFKSAPWTVDFVVYLGEEDLPYKAHYLLANELSRAGVKLAALQVDIDSASFQDNGQIAANFSHKLRLVLAGQPSEENIQAIRASKCSYDLRPQQGAGLLAVYQILKEKGSPAIAELALENLEKNQLLAKLSLNKEKLQSELLAHKELYIANFQQQLEVNKQLLKK